jgi:arylsulfatase A-like enzyme
VQAQKQRGVNPDDIDRTRRRQLVSLLTVDDEVAELVAALEDAGALDNTVILYSSDNGYSWGDHWWTKKNCSFDSCARVPMIAFDGRNPVARETDWPVMNIDLAPTILDLAGAAPPPDQKLNGTSFRSLVEGTGEPAARDAVLTECWGDSQYGPDIHAAVRTSQWKYVEHYSDHEMTEIKTRLDGDRERELYDLVRDPSESENLSHRSPAELADLGYDADQIADTMAELAGRLAALKAQ